MDWIKLQLLTMGFKQKDVTLEEGFFFFTSCMNASACQEWTQQVELTFESFKCLVNE